MYRPIFVVGDVWQVMATNLSPKANFLRERELPGIGCMLGFALGAGLLLGGGSLLLLLLLTGWSVVYSRALHKDYLESLRRLYS